MFMCCGSGGGDEISDGIIKEVLTRKVVVEVHLREVQE